MDKDQLSERFQGMVGGLVKPLSKTLLGPLFRVFTRLCLWSILSIQMLFAADHPAEDMELFLELIVNDVSTGHVALIDYKKPYYYIDTGDLKETPILFEYLEDQTQGTIVTLNGSEDVSVRYNEEWQQLYITVPTQWLPRQSIGYGSRETVESYTSFGAIVNYDLYASKPRHNSGSLNSWGGFRLFGDYGTISHSGVYNHYFGSESYQKNRYTRYDTYWQYSDEDKLYTLTVGDLITRPLVWSNAARLGGIQFSHNFKLRPDLITYPLPEFSGEVGLPSTIDLIINGSNYQSSNINPGPFDITDVTHLSGAGEAVVVTTDALGRTVSINVPFYVTSRLLRENLMDYTLSVGTLRQHYGQKNFSYSRYAIDGSMRYGVNDHLTVEFHSELATSLTLVGAGFVTNIGRIGDLNAALTLTNYKNRTGTQLYLGYNYLHPKFNFLASYIRRSSDYRDISSIDSEYGVVPESLQFTFSIPTERYGSYSIGFFSNQYQYEEGKRRSNTISLGWNKSLGEYGNVSAYINHHNNSDNRWSAALQWTIPLDNDYGQVSVAANRNDSKNDSTSVYYSRSIPSDGGFGWNLNYKNNRSNADYYNAALKWRNPNIEMQGGMYGSSGDYTYWSDLSGSLVAMDGELFMANRVYDSFVLLSADGVSDVPVLYENNVIGRTNQKGYYLVPQVPSYYDAKYEIDGLEIPVNLNVPELEKRISVKANSGYVLKFPVERINPVTLTLVDEASDYIPVGSYIETDHGEESYVGWDGAVYFEHLQAINQLTVYLPDGERCSLEVELQADDESDESAEANIIDLGEFRCHKGGSQ